ncbi:hypothetical protein LP52_03645 [Streptomonospora alba]|uniref:Uncharacterized protein n=1 Tax=Streptomonospora alba TaxID=183763 RepID=A0A0C2FL67_9ACTN|nr:hypothetical protein [Streptomonospora alba]KII00045.1 hypothetical protein LP52_03645 [Streptomonospora alba]
MASAEGPEGVRGTDRSTAREETTATTAPGTLPESSACGRSVAARTAAGALPHGVTVNGPAEPPVPARRAALERLGGALPPPRKDPRR